MIASISLECFFRVFATIISMQLTTIFMAVSAISTQLTENSMVSSGELCLLSNCDIL